MLFLLFFNCKHFWISTGISSFTQVDFLSWTYEVILIFPLLVISNILCCAWECGRMMAFEICWDFLYDQKCDLGSMCAHVRYVFSRSWCGELYMSSRWILKLYFTNLTYPPALTSWGISYREKCVQHLMVICPSFSAVSLIFVICIFWKIIRWHKAYNYAMFFFLSHWCSLS